MVTVNKLMCRFVRKGRSVSGLVFAVFLWARVTAFRSFRGRAFMVPSYCHAMAGSPFSVLLFLSAYLPGISENDTPVYPSTEVPIS